jgi:hypothetical protein
MRGVGGACKCIHCPLLYSARVRGLAASALTPRGPENNRVLYIPDVGECHAIDLWAGHFSTLVSSRAWTSSPS